jgi:hypothetical protein
VGQRPRTGEGAASVTFLRKYNPNVDDEPRIPAGEPGAGQWTTGGDAAAVPAAADHGMSLTIADDGNSAESSGSGREGSTPDASAGASEPREPNGGWPRVGSPDANSLSIAYPGDYHDAVAQALKEYLTSNGGNVITGVTLTGINGTSAVADMMVKLPNAPPFILEVKTGPGAQFTDGQRIVYPMAQVGGHVSSRNAVLKEIGLVPGELLPPLKVYVYWVVNPGDKGEFLELPPPQFVP